MWIVLRTDDHNVFTTALLNKDNAELEGDTYNSANLTRVYVTNIIATELIKAFGESDIKFKPVAIEFETPDIEDVDTKRKVTSLIKCVNKQLSIDIETAEHLYDQLTEDYNVDLCCISFVNTETDYFTFDLYADGSIEFDEDNMTVGDMKKALQFIINVIERGNLL